MVKTALVIILLLLSSSLLFAKRKAPAEVKPVVYKGVKYSVALAENNNPAMGIIEATDIKTGKQVWKTKVYEIVYIPHLETDVQWVYITKLYIEKNQLVAINETNDKYRIDLKTGKVLSGRTKIKTIINPKP